MTTRTTSHDPFDPIDGCTLDQYATICRALVRLPGGSVRQEAAALAELGLTAGRWTRIRDAWSERISSDPEIRAAFGRLYAGADAAAPTAHHTGDLP